MRWERWWLAVIQMLQGKADKLLEHGCAMKELDPGSYLGSYVTATAQAMLGNYEGAVAEFQQAAQLSGSSPVILGWLGWTHARYGRVAEAETVLQKLAGMASQRPVPPTSFAWIYAGLGDADRAFEWKEKAVAARDHILVPLRSYPHLDPLRSDPRFAHLLEGLNLTDATLERVSAVPV